MGRTSKKYNTAAYTQQAHARRASSTVVYGSFPRHVNAESPIEKLNKFLKCVLILLAVISFISYYFVSDTESAMNKLGRDITELAAENIELQNKLDNMNSFNKVDDFIRNNTSLNTAQKIIEIPSAAVYPKPYTEPYRSGWKWSAGY